MWHRLPCRLPYAHVGEFTAEQISMSSRRRYGKVALLKVDGTMTLHRKLWWDNEGPLTHSILHDELQGVGSLRS
jgi:hypothetical protein